MSKGLLADTLIGPPPGIVVTVMVISLSCKLRLSFKQ